MTQHFRFAIVFALVVSVLPNAPDAALAQASYDSVVRELRNRDKTIRLRAVRLLKEAAYPEAAGPLAPLVTDPDDDVQLEAIAAELNIFLTEKIAGRKRVGMVIEVRNSNPAETAFSAGPLVIGARNVPEVVLVALRAAATDPTPRVAIEALYAFGTLAVEPAGARRRALLGQSVTDFAPMLAVTRSDRRQAAIRVVGRLFERRADDEPVDVVLGDAIVAALNDSDTATRTAAAEALGGLRYERAIGALTQQFQYFGRGEVAETALEALARIAHPSTTSVLSAQLASKNAAFKASAIEGLARIGDRSQREAVETALGADGDDRVRLAGAFWGVALGEATLDPIVEALRKPKVAGLARRYLVELAPGRVSAFTRHLQDPDAQIRAGVADVLGLAGDVEAQPLVNGLLADRDERVVLAAERAVARLSALRARQ